MSWLKFTNYFALSIFMSSLCYAKSSVITACIDDHPPYQQLTDPPVGIHINALKKLATLFDANLNFIKSPNFARCVALLESGKADVIAGLNISEERKKFAFYAPYKVEESLVVLSRPDSKFRHYNDLYGKLIGVPRGTTYFATFDNDRSLNKVSIPSVRNGIKILIKERIDLVITSELVAKSLIDEINALEIKTTVIERVNKNNQISYFGFSKKHKLPLTDAMIIEKTKAAFNLGYFTNDESN
ncbi:MAG: transporter substrate-binding domain-containing protein [Gammaproteobacteria bacterium]|nr:transporter substrate-binding domain-containing protein [Gammaproteobacteria bacterium]